MKTWSKDCEINAPIEVVWKLFDGSLEDMQKIMPQVVSNQLVHETDDRVGSIFRQSYREGKRVMEYDVKVLEYKNNPDVKQMKITFNLANMFDITANYELNRLSEQTTYFKYTTTNNPLKWFIKLMLTFVKSDKVVVDFVERVKNVAEKEALL
ncbi:MAG TPA: SRPBCC family protein [Ureibacillus sp.]|nr:SRPBCC family protein [Ureibacillus sp.]